MHSNVTPHPLVGMIQWRWMGVISVSNIFSPKNTFLHVGWMGGTPFHAYDKAANQDMYDFIMLWTNVWERASVPKYLDTCHLCCCAKEYIARSINAHVLYCRERERI